MADRWITIEIVDNYKKIATWKFPAKETCKRMNDISSIFGLGVKVIDTKKEVDKDLDWLK
jgi:hypothetical protein